MDDQSFRKILTRFGLSWDGYRRVRKGVKKRIVRHMQDLGCNNVDRYLERLARDSAQTVQCHRLLDVSISRFFRDRQLWQALEKVALPDILTRWSETIRAWSAGCALGQEAYSLKIVWNKLTDRRSPSPELNIRASDVNGLYLRKARQGIYPGSTLREVPESWRDRYFKPTSRNRSYSVVESLKEGIHWEVRDFLTSVPPEHFHLIFLRNNLLTYYEEQIKTPAFERILGCLHTEGFLAIGSHEKIPSGFTNRLAPFGHRSLYRKVNN